MAEELRETKNRIYRDTPEFLMDCEYIATVGDICTLKIFEEIREPNLCIVDMKTKRDTPLDKKQKEEMRNIGRETTTVNNEAGTISAELWNSIEKALENNVNTKILVEGEEDLATLAVISMANLGAKVIYGMPDRGMVVVDVNQQEKMRADSFLKRMLVN